MTGWSNGNSFNNGDSMNAAGRCREPWYIRLLGPVQDRGSI